MSHTTSPTSVVRRETRGFTLVELLVVIGIIALLIAMLMPALNRARDSANTVACLSNHKQVVLSLLMYAHHNKGHFPYSSKYAAANHVTFRDWSIAQRTLGARRCTGQGSRHYNLLTLSLAPGGWNNGHGSDVEDPRWITASSRFVTRNDTWQQNPNWNNNPTERWRVAKKITWARPASQVMLTADAYVPTQMDAVHGATPSEGGDSVGPDYSNAAERLRFRHGMNLDRINLGFVDGHAETWEYSSIRPAPPGWQTRSSFERHLFSDNRYLPWGTEWTKP
jgi:prepilin-type N-terminal cleavage/methylation domain-containing protein/prepilin-type processing-associated H-X9-DG protein